MPTAPVLPTASTRTTCRSPTTLPDVGDDFNFRNLTTDVSFDAEVAIDTLNPTARLTSTGSRRRARRSGHRHITGTAGADYIDGNNHPTLGAATDADDLNGRGGNDFLFGRGGNDATGGGGDDTIDGGDGNDTVTGGDGSDNMEGGAGTDKALFEHDINEYTIVLGPNDTYAVTRGADTDFVHGFENIQFAGGPLIDIINHPDQLQNTHNPVFSSGTSNNVNENVPVTTVVYDANATDADTTFGNITFSLGNTGNSLLFNIDAATGEVRLDAKPGSRGEGELHV